MKKLALALMATATLSGCSQALREVGQAPAMSPIGTGLQYGQTPQMALYPKQPRTTSTGYSIWSDQQSALFKDSRAISVGDIMTVNIKVNDRASFDNETERSRTNKSGINFGASASDTHGRPPPSQVSTATATAARPIATICMRTRRSPSNTAPTSTVISGFM